MKSAFVLEMINQHENQRAVFGRKASKPFFKLRLEWKSIGAIAQALGSFNDFKCPEKEINCTEQQTN